MPEMYELTDHGARSLRTARFVSKAPPLYVIRDGLDLEQHSVFELVQLLKQDGWSWHKLPTSAVARRRLHFRVDDDPDRVWYTSGRQVKREYLMCLLRARSLLTQYGIESVPHWASKDRIYTSLLQGILVEDPRRELLLRLPLALPSVVWRLVGPAMCREHGEE